MHETVTLPKELYDRMVSVVDNVVCMETCHCDEDGRDNCILCNAQKIQVDLMDLAAAHG